jgi:hypothetical protein
MTVAWRFSCRHPTDRRAVNKDLPLSRTFPEAVSTLEAASSECAPRILIVDDERALMRALCDSLGVEGYSTRGTVSAQEALSTLKPGEFDLVITDLMMPEMDGITLTRAAQQIDPALVAIVMTGHGTIDTAVRAMQDGALDYILKPFKLDAILIAISRALDVQRLRRENARLQDSERRKTQELELAIKDLESFSYTVSHDLRAPLRAIDSYSQMLAEDHAATLDAEGRRLIEVIRGGAQSLDQLIVGLLEFSRTASGTRLLEIDRVDMSSLAAVACEEARVSYQGSEPEIVLGELPDASGDALLLRQVWVNLIGNALKYSAKRPHPRVVISGYIGDAGETVYQVEDNGAGFDMRYAEKLFGVFQRLHRNSEFAGTGVGLAIVHRIVARHGGRVWAEGRVDVGATFRFCLPLRVIENTDSERIRAAG